MPTRVIWTPRAVFLQHNGVTIYHAYEDDTDGPKPKRFSFSTYRGDGPEAATFDVRDLPAPKEGGLHARPPYLGSPEFLEATAQQQCAIRGQWAKWTTPGGGEDQAIVQTLIAAIDAGLIQAPPGTEFIPPCAFNLRADRVADILAAYARDIKVPDGMTLAGMAEWLVPQIDEARLEQAAYAAGDDFDAQIIGGCLELRSILVEMNVIYPRTAS